MRRSSVHSVHVDYRVLALNADDVTVMDQLAVLYHKTGRLHEADELFTRIHDLHPHHRESRLHYVSNPLLLLLNSLIILLFLVSISEVVKIQHRFTSLLACLSIDDQCKLCSPIRPSRRDLISKCCFIFTTNILRQHSLLF